MQNDRFIPRPLAAGRAARRRRRPRRATPRSAPRRNGRSACRRRARAPFPSAPEAVKAPSASLPACASATLSPRPSARPKAKLRDWADEQVSTRSPSPERPISVWPPRAEGVAEPAQFGKAARHQRRRRARAEAASGGDAAGDREHVLGRAADLDAADVGRVVEAEVRPVQKAAERAGERLVARASVTAVGRPAATSAAKDGPDRIAAGAVRAPPVAGPRS